MKRVEWIRSRYVDSVTLMNVAERAARLPGVTNAEAVMATAANLELLTGAGYEPPRAEANDLLLAASGEGADAAVAAMRAALERGGGPGARRYRDLSDVDLKEDGYDLVQISLPGAYAADEAKKALDKGLDVFIFSDNVSLADERALKELGRAKNRLVMGPDCGVGWMGGVALAAGSQYRDGPVGIVGASGSGAQEVGCLVERMGLGVRALIGTGGRDLYPEIGGITMKMAMRRLDADPGVRVIALVSKLADAGVMRDVLSGAQRLSKPVVAVFLGADGAVFEGMNVRRADSLEEAARLAVETVTGAAPAFGWTDEALDAICEDELARLSPAQRDFRGLYCGGTFTEEALIYFSRHNREGLYSNLRTRYADPLPPSGESVGNAILDLGAEEFTAAAPHPVFDPAIRLRRFEKELEDERLAVVLLDFITGPGVHEDPVRPFVAAYREGLRRRGDHVTCIATICGTDEDPQNVSALRALLEGAGVRVADSNCQSARLASRLMTRLSQRR